MEYSYQLVKIDKNRERYIFNMTLEFFFKLLSTNNLFIETIINIFINSEFNYVYWQFPEYSSLTKNNQAQFDFVNTSSFTNADPRDFSDKFIGKVSGEIIMFGNKSGDTDLISIVPLKSNHVNSFFSDIMTFMLKSPDLLKINMLKMIGSEMFKRKNKCYLSTHGNGVEWIHIRLCNTPKYYV